MADIDTTVGNLAGTAVGVGVAVWGLNEVSKGLARSRRPYRRALPPGKRVSKSGKTYYESRPNRSQVRTNPFAFDMG